MGKPKKTTSSGPPVLTPEENKLLEALLGDLRRVDPNRFLEEPLGSRLAEALAKRLPVADARTPRILQGLKSSFPEKNVQKAIKKTAFKLRQKGIFLPEEEDSEAPTTKIAKRNGAGASAYLGPIDGTGSRPVFVSVPQLPSGADLAIGVVNDEGGIIEFAFSTHSKKRMNEIKGIFFRNLPHMVETTLSHAADVLERAYRAKGPEVSDSARAYLRFRPWLIGNSSALGRPVVYSLLPPETVSSDPVTESQLLRLFENEFMASWVLDLKTLMPLIEEIRKAEESRLFISEGQRLEHIQRMKYEALPNLFSETRKGRLKYRLEEMAYVFLKTAQEKLARLCLAVAASLSRDESPIVINPFFRLLLERSLAHYLRSSRSPEPPSAPGEQKLIVT